MDDINLNTVFSNLSAYSEDNFSQRNIHQINAAMQKFAWPDYLVFVLMLVICIIIGIYFGFVKTVKTELDYLMGGRSMKVFPVSMSLIATREKDQLLPLLVMDVVGNIPGLPGLFLAGIFSASLSSLSTGLNSLVAIILEDFYRPAFKEELSERHKEIVMKSAVVIFGAIFVGLVFIVEHLGTVLQLSMSIGTISSGPSLALFTMGMLLPWINSTGALVGSFSGLAVMTYFAMSVQTAIGNGKLVFEEKPVSTEGCQYDFIPKTVPPVINLGEDGLINSSVADELPFIFQISYLWYTLMGLIVCCVFGLLTSFIGLGGGSLDPKDIDPALLAPVVRGLIKPKNLTNQPPTTDQIMLANEPRTYIISTIATNALPTNKDDETAARTYKF